MIVVQGIAGEQRLACDIHARLCGKDLRRRRSIRSSMAASTVDAARTMTSATAEVFIARVDKLADSARNGSPIRSIRPNATNLIGADA